MNYRLLITDYRFHPFYAWALIAMLSVAVIALFVNLQTAVMTLFFVTLAWWVWLAPTSGFFFLLVLSPLLPLFKVTQSIGTVTLLKDMVILTLFARLFACPLLQRQLPYRRNLLVAPLALLLVWIGQALLRADNLLLGVLRARELVLYVLLYVAVLYLPLNRRLYRELLAWVLLAFVAVTLLSVYQWEFARDSAVLRFDPGRQIWIPRLSSTFGHPSVFGEYVAGIASMLLALGLRLRGSLARWAWVGFATCLPLIYLTYSRAVWVGFAVAAVAILAASTLAYVKHGQVLRLPWPKIAVSGIVALLAVVAVVQFTQVGVFLKSAFDTQYKSNEVRLEFLARLVAPVTTAQAFIGRGLGDVVAQNFREVDLRGLDIATTASRTIQLAKDSTLVDNQYLKTFVELGLLGLLIYAWLLWRILVGSLRLVTTAQPRDTRSYVVGLLGIGFMSAFIIQALFIDIWDVFPTNMLFWLVAGLVSANATGYTNTPRPLSEQRI